MVPIDCMQMEIVRSDGRNTNALFNYFNYICIRIFQPVIGPQQENRMTCLPSWRVFYLNIILLNSYQNSNTRASSHSIKVMPYLFLIERRRNVVVATGDIGIEADCEYMNMEITSRRTIGDELLETNNRRRTIGGEQ